MPDPATTTEPAPAASSEPGTKKGGKKNIVIPIGAFKSRVEREARNILGQVIKDELGVGSLAELKQKLGSGQGGKPQPNSDGGGELKKRLDEMTAKAAAADALTAQLKKRIDKEVRRGRDVKIEADMRVAAVKAGINDPDYAVHLYAGALRAAKEGEEVAPEKFFEDLKTSHRSLFDAAPAAPAVPAAAPPAAPAADAAGAAAPAAPAAGAAPAAPPAPVVPPVLPSTAPGGAAPPPVPPGRLAPVDDVSKLDHAAFARRTREKYGYTPGT